MENQKIIALGEKLKDEEYAAKFIGLTADEAIKLLAEDGLVFTQEEFAEIGKIVQEDSDIELNENDLDMVAGGSWKKCWGGGLKATLRGFWVGIKAGLKG